MLKSLFIQNFVLIDSLDIQFEKGFSVITGETGAGKSIILGALSLVLGQRADGKSIKKDADKCVIEAVFDIRQYSLEPFFLSNDLEYDAESCILRRELYASGKSRAFVNDSPVSLAIMKELGTKLIDIHSQHQNLLLGDNRFQLRVVDVMAENEILLILYRKEYSRYQALKKELKELKEKAAQTKQEEDYIRFQLDQLEEAHLSAGEQEELEQEQETLSHAEEIKGTLYKVSQLLDGEEIWRTAADLSYQGQKEYVDLYNKGRSSAIAMPAPEDYNQGKGSSFYFYLDQSWQIPAGSSLQLYADITDHHSLHYWALGGAYTVDSQGRLDVDHELLYLDCSVYDDQGQMLWQADDRLFR